jgi:hypothetical protein
MKFCRLNIDKTRFKNYFTISIFQARLLALQILYFYLLFSKKNKSDFNQKTFIQSIDCLRLNLEIMSRGESFARG